MLPDPRVKDQWRGENVLWYPARFIKHNAHTRIAKNEFQFRFLECVGWPRTEDELMRPSRHYSQDRSFCEEILKVALRPEQVSMLSINWCKSLNSAQMGTIRFPAFADEKPPEDHPLIKIFDAAAAPLAQLLTSFPDDHPVVNSYNRFFADRPEDDRDDCVEKWLPAGFNEPFKELTTLMERSLEKLQDFRRVSVPGRERQRRVIGVGRAMLQVLALQHELKESLNLNGDTFEELVERAIVPADMEWKEGLWAMVFATRPKQLIHKRYWDKEGFGDVVRQLDSHVVYDPTFRPPTYNRMEERQSRRPAMVLQAATGAEEHAAQSDEESLGKIRSRKDDDDEDEDAPPPKRQATPRKLRPRGPKAVVATQAAAEPVGEVVARGRGWITIAVDE